LHISDVGSRFGYLILSLLPKFAFLNDAHSKRVKRFETYQFEDILNFKKLKVSLNAESFYKIFSFVSLLQAAVDHFNIEYDFFCVLV
jgi:hypothetical protein